MVTALSKARSHALVPLKRLVYTADIKVARDAAQSLSRFVPKYDAAQLVGTVLRRALSKGLDKNMCLWATDLLREITGRDFDYWPGKNDLLITGRWLEFLDKERQLRELDISIDSIQ